MFYESAHTQAIIIFGCPYQKLSSCYLQEVANVLVGTSDDYRTEQLMLSVEEDNQQNQNLQNSNLQDDVNQNLQPTQQKENLKGTQCSVIRPGKVFSLFQAISMHIFPESKGIFLTRSFSSTRIKNQNLLFSVISKECISSSSVHNV